MKYRVPLFFQIASSVAPLYLTGDFKLFLMPFSGSGWSSCPRIVRTSPCVGLGWSGASASSGTRLRFDKAWHAGAAIMCNRSFYQPWAGADYWKIYPANFWVRLLRARRYLLSRGEIGALSSYTRAFKRNSLLLKYAHRKHWAFHPPDYSQAIFIRRLRPDKTFQCLRFSIVTG